MTAPARRDGVHFDGGWSLPHAGITIFGTRTVEFWHADGACQSFLQEPGSVYVGNLCAVKHEVVHSGGAAPDGSHGLQVAVMLRSDVFGGIYG